MFAITTRLAAAPTVISFVEFLPSGIDPVLQLWKRIVAIRDSSALPENRVKAYYDLAREYGNFASIRAQLYAHISTLNKQNGDLYSAFVAKWRLCAFIAHVLALKKKSIAGIPPVFPLVYDEPPVDPTAFERAHGYLVMEAEILTRSSWALEMEIALQYVKLAHLGWIVSHVSGPLFNFLENRLDFSTLAELYPLVHGVFEDLAEEGTPRPLEFWRVFASEEARSITQFSDVVYVACEGHAKFVESLHALGIAVVESLNPNLPDLTDKMVCFTRLLPLFGHDVVKLRARAFFADFIHTPNANWNEPYAERHIHETRVSLPHFVSFSEIGQSKILQFTKLDYFLDRLRKFSVGFRRLLDSYRAVLPPRKMLPNWANCPLNMDTRPLLAKLEQIAAGDPREHPYFAFVLEEHQLNVERPADVAQELAAISDHVWSLAEQSIMLANRIYQTNPPKAAMRELIQSHALVFRVNLH
jgi:hypothetical protein